MLQFGWEVRWILVRDWAVWFGERYEEMSGGMLGGRYSGKKKRITMPKVCQKLYQNRKSEKFISIKQFKTWNEDEKSKEI